MRLVRYDWGNDAPWGSGNSPLLFLSAMSPLTFSFLSGCRYVVRQQVEYERLHANFSFSLPLASPHAYSCPLFLPLLANSFWLRVLPADPLLFFPPFFSFLLLFTVPPLSPVRVTQLKTSANHRARFFFFSPFVLIYTFFPPLVGGDKPDKIFIRTLPFPLSGRRLSPFSPYS